MSTDRWIDVDTVDGARRWFTRGSIAERQAGALLIAGGTLLAAYDAQTAEVDRLRAELQAERATSAKTS
jgi:hypothetical protein